MSKKTVTTLTLTGMSTTELSSSELASAINIIIGADAQEKATGWMKASQFANIINNDLWEDDFTNAKEFADFVGYNKSLISQYTNAYNWLISQDLFTVDNLSVIKAYNLSTLKDRCEEFIKWCESNNLLITAMSDKGLKDVIKEWKKETEAIEVDETGEVENADTDVETEEELEDVAIIEYDGRKFIVPLEVLAQYEV